MNLLLIAVVFIGMYFVLRKAIEDGIYSGLKKYKEDKKDN